MESIIRLVGLEAKHIKNGLRFGVGVSALLGAIMLGTYLYDPSLYGDEDQVSTLGRLILDVLIIIPLTVVLLEELVFRGLIYGFIDKKLGAKLAVAGSSLLFGLWHVWSASSAEVPFEGSEEVKIGSVILFTALAGVVFALLRFRSKSLLAPILLHWTANAFGTILAFTYFN